MIRSHVPDEGWIIGVDTSTHFLGRRLLQIDKVRAQVPYLLLNVRRTVKPCEKHVIIINFPHYYSIMFHNLLDASHGCARKTMLRGKNDFYAFTCIISCSLKPIYKLLIKTLNVLVQIILYRRKTHLWHFRKRIQTEM